MNRPALPGGPWAARLHRWAWADDARAHGLALGLSAALLGGLFAAMLATGPAVLNGFPWDAPAFLDGAWKLDHGRLPHSGFYTIFGPLVFWLTWLGTKVTGWSMLAVPVGAALWATVLWAGAWVVLWRRTPAAAALAASVFVGLLACAPRALGQPGWLLDYAMVHNRLGEATLMVLALALFLPGRPGEGAVSRALGAGLAGVLLAALPFTKISSFAVGLGLWTVALILGPRRLWLVVGLAVAAGAGAAVVWVAGLDMGLWLRDTDTMLRSRVSGGLAASATTQTLKHGPLLLWGALLLALAGRRCSGDAWRWWAVPAAIAGGSLLALATNTQRGELPLLAAAVVMALVTLAPALRRRPRDGAIAILATLPFWAPTFAEDLAAVRGQAFDVLRGQYETEKWLGFRDFRLPPGGSPYTGKLVEGERFLQRVPAGAAVQVIAFTNPYEIGRRAPAPYSATHWDVNSTYSLAAQPPGRPLFDGVPYLLVEHEQEDVFYNAYQGVLERTPREILDHGRYWTLWGPPPPPPEAP